ncbi:MBL fold metallo-hydrolase [Pedobacter sp. AW31-3R]|uniref:MBL fold metallo-hydrolase n=1 Tax=Pedobacter sp. AW31-3R TaxID=3445781 RepID=UPI003FA0EA57
MKYIFTPLLLTFMFGFQGFSQHVPIQTFKAAKDIYLVGDRTFSCFVITTAGVIVIDPLDSVHAVATMKAIRKITDKPIKQVIYSHNHWDHISGGQIFKEAGATFLAHQQAAENIEPSPKVILPDSTWTGQRSTFTLGDKTIELYFYGRNHGDGMTLFRFPEQRALFVVDLVVPDRVLYAYLPDAKPKNWLKHLYEIRKLDFDTLYMAHVRPIGTRKDLDLNISYFEDLYAATEKAMQDGTPFFDIPTSVKMPQYEHLMNYKEWLHMNVWRILMEKSIGK